MHIQPLPPNTRNAHDDLVDGGTIKVIVAHQGLNEGTQSLVHLHADGRVTRDVLAAGKRLSQNGWQWRHIDISGPCATVQLPQSR